MARARLARRVEDRPDAVGAEPVRTVLALLAPARYPSRPFPAAVAATTPLEATGASRTDSGLGKQFIPFGVAAFRCLTTQP